MTLSNNSLEALADVLSEDFNCFLHEFYEQQFSELLALLFCLLIPSLVLWIRPCQLSRSSSYAATGYLYRNRELIPLPFVILQCNRPCSFSRRERIFTAMRYGSNALVILGYFVLMNVDLTTGIIISFLVPA